MRTWIAFEIFAHDWIQEREGNLPQDLHPSLWSVATQAIKDAFYIEAGEHLGRHMHYEASPLALDSHDRLWGYDVKKESFYTINLGGDNRRDADPADFEPKKAR